MFEESLFPELDGASSPKSRSAPSATRPEQARLNRPVRNQVEVMLRDVDSLLAKDHSARAIWAVLERFDLSSFYSSIKAVEGVAGRPASDPRVLLALWIYATSEGIGKARELGRLCEESDAYRWLRGGVPVNYHMLSDFRVEHGASVNKLMAEVLAVMMNGGLVSLKRVAQDGMRVRAGAGAASFRREPTLSEFLKQASDRVERLALERDKPDAQANRREEAARERSARERQKKIEQALAELPKVRAIKKTEEKRLEARVSTTDPEARVMKMADGGFRPA
jgi:transposase